MPVSLANASSTDDAGQDKPDLDITAELERLQVRLAAIAAAKAFFLIRQTF